jgi:NADP-dependent 3-hydroxy acid dehydrogenase YdfG
VTIKWSGSPGRADLAEKIAANGGQAVAVAADVTDDDAVTSAADAVHRRFGPVDLVVNAAGVMLPNPVEAGRDDEWLTMLNTNLGGVLRVIRAFTADLLAAAQGGTADLVNISSIGARTWPSPTTPSTAPPRRH